MSRTFCKSALYCKALFRSMVFHQGLITNDIHFLEEKVGSSLFAALLTSRGRIAHDLILHRDQDKPGDDAVLIDGDRRSINQCIKTFQKYRMRSDVVINDISTTHSICCIMSKEQFSGRRSHCLDPRLSSLGMRFVSANDELKQVSQGWQVVSPEEHKLWRIQNGVPEGQDEIPVDALPLEYNMDALNGISFTKGCYIGQELTARTHFQGVIRKRVIPGQLVSPSPLVSEKSEIRLEPEEKIVGQVRAVSGDWILMFVRLQAALDSLSVSTRKLMVEDVEVKVKIPLWWPEEWSK